MRRICFSWAHATDCTFSRYLHLKSLTRSMQEVLSQMQGVVDRAEGLEEEKSSAFHTQTLLWPGLAWAAAGHWGGHLMLGGGGELRTSPGGNPHSALKHQLSITTLALNSLFILSIETGQSWGQRACPGPKAVTEAPQPHWSALGT